MFTRCLATEWGSYNVTVNAIAPGSVLTDLSAPVLNDAERKERILKAVPLQRLAEPKEIGLLAAYLASDAAAYVTGQTFFIDGGQVSRGNGF
jgi:NAD(P)-dependent dehydrogenase (short-subunit alcohol dehydrogenase family)